MHPRVRPAYRVRACNTALDSANAIHHDDVARDYGFRGGLVPGVDVYAYMTHAPAREWGLEWVERGTMTARFHKPVYDGEEVAVEAHVEGDSVAIKLSNAAGEVCATGRATRGHEQAPPDPSIYAVAPLPDPPSPATREAFEARPTLGAIETTLDEGSIGEFLGEVGENLALYRDGRIGHPAHLLRTCNWIFAANVQLGPWIHAQSDCLHFAAARWGERVETRGRVAALYERKGHRFVDLDLLVVGSDLRPLMHVRHVAIYEPARIRP